MQAETGCEKGGNAKKSLVDQLKHIQQEPLSRNALISKDSCAVSTGDCPQCRGEGIVQGRRGIYASAELCVCVQNCRLCLGKNMDVSGGVARACKSPSPLKRSNLYNRACIPARYTGARLEKFSNNSGNCMEIARNVTAWVDKLTRSTDLHRQKGFILSGPVGCGKTWLLAAVAKRLASHGISIRFVDFFQLISEIKSALMTREAITSDFLRVFLEVDVLAIDELGKGRRTDFEQTVLDQLVMGRYNQEKIIIASTNCRIGRLYRKDADYFGEAPRSEGARFDVTDVPLFQAVGERIYSRLEETTEFLAMKGSDMRSDGRSS
ncbi:MAG: ATP-binding protein [Deltaproteobacteria bacterium]|nr:ATP-binding protein [Deltaproteobacteria bacterium]